jgi:hypothetical protein
MIVYAPNVNSARIIGAQASPSAPQPSSGNSISSSDGGRSSLRPTGRRLRPSNRSAVYLLGPVQVVHELDHHWEVVRRNADQLAPPRSELG